MPNSKIRFLAEGAMIAAIYIVLTLFSRLLGIADGAVQFRLSEALTILPVFTPAAIPGLTIGCLFANLGSPFGLPDILCGTLATFVAALFTRLLRNICVKGLSVLAPLPPILFNALFVGLLIAAMNEAGQLLPQNLTPAAFWASAGTVALGEAVVCIGLGVPFMAALQKSGASRRLFLH